MSKQTKSLKTLSHDELKSKEKELRENLFKLNLQRVTGQLANSSQLKSNRKDLARVLTFMTEKTRTQ